MELNRNAVISRIQSRTLTIDEFNFDKLIALPLYSLLTVDDINKLYQIATSVKYSGNARKKYKAIDDVLKPRGFTKLGSGTNRVVYKFLEDSSFVIKVAYDAVGIKDNPREFVNQKIFKPFITKIFEVDPTGTVAVAERVIPVTSREEFLSIAPDVYEVINDWFIGEHIMADIGTNFFMNWATRKGFGPVLLDFPYVYELDGNKLYCSAVDVNSQTGTCGGEIDYDDGFNFLRCTKCGIRYRVRELAKAIKEENIIIKGNRRKSKMNVAVRTKVNSGVSNVTEEVVVRQEVPSITTSAPRRDINKSQQMQQKPNVGGKNNYDKNGKNNKSYHNNHGVRPNNNIGNNRGIVRDTSNNTASISIEPIEKSINEVNIEKDIFKFSGFDANKHLLFIEGSKGNKLTLLTNSFDKEIFNIFFEKSEYMTELEQAKNDLLVKEEALETEKESNTILSEDLEAANLTISDLNKAIDKANEDYRELEKQTAEEFDELEKQNNDLTDKISNLEDRYKKERGTLDIRIKELEKELETKTNKVNENEAKEDSIMVDISVIREKDKEIESLNATILELSQQVAELSTNDKRESVDKVEFEKLKEEVKREKAKAENIKADYDAKINEYKELLKESNEKLDNLMSNDTTISPILPESKEIDFSEYDNMFSCIHGISTTFNKILETITDKNEFITRYNIDHNVIAFPDGSGSFIKDIDGNIIVAVSIDNTNLDDITLIGKDHYESMSKKYEILKKIKSTPVGVEQK